VKRTPFLVVDIAIVTAYSICRMIRKVVGRFVGLWDNSGGSNSEVAEQFREAAKLFRSCRTVRRAAKQFARQFAEQFGELQDDSRRLQSYSEAAGQFEGLQSHLQDNL
jgi:hypothetical protein